MAGMFFLGAALGDEEMLATSAMVMPSKLKRLRILEQRLWLERSWSFQLVIQLRTYDLSMQDESGCGPGLGRADSHLRHPVAPCLTHMNYFGLMLSTRFSSLIR